MRTLLSLTAVSLLTACPLGGGGPCSSPDVLFPSPRVDASSTDAGVNIAVSWQASPSTPAAFYATPRLETRSALSLRVADAGPTGAQVVSESPGDAGLVEFSLLYDEGPTRTCRHVGMDDTYELQVSVPLPPDGGTVTTSTRLGAL